MKRSVIGFIISSVVGLLTEQTWAHDSGGASGRIFWSSFNRPAMSLSLDPDRA